MSVRSRIPVIARDVELMISELLSPEAQSRHLADYAREELAEAKAEGKAVLGREPDHDAFVDGRRSDDLDTVRPNGRIVFEFELANEALAWIGEQLVWNSPVLTGQYARSHILLVDGVEVDPGAVPDGKEYIFMNAVPYARKIERGYSPQAPDGVYEAIAGVAQRRFGNIVKIFFTFHSLVEGDKRGTYRYPCIIVEV